MSFISVTGITLSPTLSQLVVGQATSFTATVQPSNATNQTIVWSRVSGVNCTINSTNNGKNLTLTAQASGSLSLRATIANGKLQ